jgi:glycosyltransferase involved in cell wall biosynthesis
MHIALVGPYPPPYGGISVHIQRLEQHLKRNNIRVHVYKNASVWDWLAASAWRRQKYDIVHFHDIDWRARGAMGLVKALGVRAVLSIHGNSLETQLTNLNPLYRSILIRGLKTVQHLVVVNSQIRDILLSIGIPQERISVINAYLPPVVTEADRASLPKSIRDFLAEHDPVLAANAFGALPHALGDLYGIGLTIRLCDRMRLEFPNLGCLFYLSQTGNPTVLAHLEEEVTELDLQENFRFVYGQPFPPILPESSVFLRPTLEDGYGISIDEAIDMGIPAVASDVCPRAPEAILFRANDLDDYQRAVHQALKMPQIPTRANKYLSFNNLYELYQRLCLDHKA